MKMTWPEKKAVEFRIREAVYGFLNEDLCAKKLRWYERVLLWLRVRRTVKR